MPSEVIMPALGMTQDTGRLVSWLKAIGDTVSADDPLMEVETDKTTMEVPAGAAGILAELRAEPGDDVPVGNVIAIIAVDGETVAPKASEPQARATEQPEPEPKQSASTPTPALDAPKPVAQAYTDARILASPKARRLAAERGLDLASLVKAGIAQPYHVADLERIKPSGAAPSAAVSPSAIVSHVTARADAAAFDALLEEMAARLAQPLDPHILVAGFAASALREDHQAETLIVAVEVGVESARMLYLDPDRHRPSRPRRADDNAMPDLILRDMTGARITAIAIGSDVVPSLTLGRDRTAFTLSLSFREDMLSSGAAIRLIDDFARRLEHPLETLV